MKRNTAYGSATGLFCLALGGSGLGHLLRAAPMAEGMAALGYPAYMMTLLGVAKLLGVTALLAPGRSLLKEWAYAGFTFNLLGATASHLLAGDPIGDALPPFVLLGVGAVSYHLRPASRRLVSATDPKAYDPAPEAA